MNIKRSFLSRSVASTCSRSLLAAAIASSSLPVMAKDYSVGELGIRWSNQISYGVGWRTESPDGGQVSEYGTKGLADNPRGSSYNYDDGTLNFEKGDIFTNVLKANTELELSWRNFGAFFRAKAFYDRELVDGDRPWKDLNDETIDAAGKGYELLDNYIWADFDIGSMPVSLRLGSQVVSWGESTFIQNGINSINPVDVASFRRPGAEIKEVLLPVNMFYTSIGLTGDITLEAFYQLEWKKTRIDPCGTLFSTIDFVADGCGPVILAGDAGEKAYVEFRDNELHKALVDRTAPIAERMPDNKPDDDGQYGLALRWYSEALGSTEFGLYYMNIHSRTPNIGGVLTNLSDRDDSTSIINPNAEVSSKWPLYRIDYAEDIKIMGLSFATSTDSGYSVSGEVSYKKDYPVQWNAFEVLLSGLGVPFSRLYNQRLTEAGAFQGSTPTEIQASVQQAREKIHGVASPGFDRFNIWQAQMTMIKFYNRVLGADKLNLVGEVGVTYVESLPYGDDTRYGRSGAFGLGNAAGVSSLFGNLEPCVTGVPPTGTAANENPDYCTDEGFVDKISAGIRIRGSLDYNDAFAGVNISPNFGIGYDKGNSPDAGQQFLDSRLTKNLGVKFVYLYKFAFNVNYTMYSGGKYNQLADRDNVTLSASYSF